MQISVMSMQALPCSLSPSRRRANAIRDFRVRTLVFAETRRDREIDRLPLAETKVDPVVT
jgi:hypothetical protein